MVWECLQGLLAHLRKIAVVFVKLGQSLVLKPPTARDDLELLAVTLIENLRTYGKNDKIAPNRIRGIAMNVVQAGERNYIDRLGVL